MRSDWIDLVDWKFVLTGIAIGVVAPALMTLLFVAFNLTVLSLPMLLLTELSVLIGGLVASWRSEERRGRLLNGLIVALICAMISFISGVLADADTGANLPGIIFLFTSYGVAGILGGLLTELIQNVQASRA
jgi:putative membrane protein (TIGR04086 family)